MKPRDAAQFPVIDRTLFPPYTQSRELSSPRDSDGVGKLSPRGPTEGTFAEGMFVEQSSKDGGKKRPRRGASHLIVTSSVIMPTSNCGSVSVANSKRAEEQLLCPWDTGRL